ncbi:tripeptidyl-peptidase (TppA), putative [Talaromyces stipitatus ATCC 10500]|uniref:tripeptidyl-peptidase II n=1 Tax=Talaromyces stipitatus (strain ATCC 10500 / CBS 375.48 / QM 6759 / NRRL 1006) TaxID=441959 RepID=B8ME98_TALSN|nr:tripeptidyl-peptidase (TppA), putative [Talaromyces stipitatus ATCC 10500]EED16525.1 tripeptidyl-peptidase (TppA), putative [Talaromyces stipitatus ATCC 10500]
MHFPFYGAAALLIATLCLFGSPVASETFDRSEAAPEGWTSTGVPSEDQPIRLQIALQQNNSVGFEQALLAISTPGDPSYGKHFTSYDQMKEMLLPSTEAVSAVRDWLTSSGVTDFQRDADWVTIRTSVRVANSLLDANFTWYTGGQQSVRILRTFEYSVPDNIAPHIRMIHPTTGFGQVRANRAAFRSMPLKFGTSLNSAASNMSVNQCGSVTTPSCIQKLYYIQNYTADPGRGSKIAFVSFTEQVARYDDLAMFESYLAPYAVGQNFTAVEYNGGINDQHRNETGEANLDLQYIVGLAAPLPVTEYIVGGRGELIPDLTEPDQNHNYNEPFLNFLLDILKVEQEDLPQVISISYGDDEQTIPKEYALIVCNLFAQLGSRGVSVLLAAGDSGVGSACQTNDAKKRDHFPPQFPSTCPWVTSVGGTNGTHPEQAVYFSSGGFSDLFPRPSYQNDAINAYLETLGDRQAEYFDLLGRGFPDVAAQSVGYVIVDKGSPTISDGTSAAAPAFSAIIALLNDARLEAGLPAMGFLNPWLYSVGRLGLNDIVHGGSTGCNGKDRFGGPPNGSPVIPYANWNATQGWDPVTGLGTPNFAKLKELALGQVCIGK